LARGGEECFRMSSTQSTQSGRNAAIVRNCQAPHLFTKGQLSLDIKYSCVMMFLP
jgi:hypothetical protein